MPNTDYKDIERLHSEWSRMEKSAKLGWLMREKMRLNDLINQLAKYIAVKGGFSNEVERDYARNLLDMMEKVDAEGNKEANDLMVDSLKELTKNVAR